MPEAKSFEFLKAGDHIHLMGICGTAMASLAGLLKEAGYRVTGSDEQAYPPMSTQLEELGIGILPGYKKEHFNDRPDLVIVGNVIRRDMEQTLALLDSDIPYTSLPVALSEFVIRDRESIVIAGTHGKTTSTSMAAWAVKGEGHKPGFLIGGIPINFQRSFSEGGDPYFVIEGDEYDTAFFDKVPKFIHYKPRHVILTSVEFDHADIYKDLDDVKSAFDRLIKLIPSSGSLIYHGSDSNIQDLIAKNNLPQRTYSFGLDSSADYQALNINRDGLKTTFDVSFKGEIIHSFELFLLADYNVLNALGVIALAHSLKWSMKNLAESLKSFKGVKRRQEVLGEPGGVLVIEDFAHHPTAVQGTIQAIKKAFPERRLFAVFEPRSATSRRRVFQEAYGLAFKAADFSFLAEPYDQSRINESDRFSTSELINTLISHGKSAKSFKAVDAIVDEIKNSARAGDIVLIMSNGGFDGIYKKVVQGLGQTPAL